MSNPSRRGDDHPYQSGLNQISDITSSSSSSADAIFSMYLKRAEKEGKRTAKGWKEEADNVFLFTAIFSVVVATLITMSIQDIQANPLDTSNFYLANIQKALTDPNISLPSSPPPFSPPTYGIWVNSLWFLSLVISMTCAVLANLIQQWARKFLKVTRTRPTASEPRRARYHAFYADGVENFRLPWVFEALPAMLHLSVFLFFAGLVMFLWNFDPTISKLILSWVSGCVIPYWYITFIPTFRHDSPYHTPLSPLAWGIVTGIPFLASWLNESIAWHGVNLSRLSSSHVSRPFQIVFLFYRIDLSHWAEATDRHRKILVQGLQKTVEKAALGLQSGLSGRGFMWTFDSLHDDKELERFFSSLPSFRRSNDDDKFLSRLTEDQKENLWTGFIGFLDRTLSSDSLHETVKDLRVRICKNALDSAAFPYILDGVVSEGHRAPVRSAKIVHLFRDWNGTNEANPMLVQAIVSSVVVTAQLCNDDWFNIAFKELGVAKSDLQNYTTHDLSLAILIHVTCQQFKNFKESSWPSDKFAKVLRAASKFKVQQSSPELQRGFCTLWNHVVRQARADDGHSVKIARFILIPIYKVFIDMHTRRTNAAPRTRFLGPADYCANVLIDYLLRYPLCYRAEHQSNWTAHPPRAPTDITFARIAALVHFSPETSSSRVVATAPGASPVMSTALDPGATAEDDGNRAITANMLDPHSSSLPSVAESNRAIADRSQEINAGRVGGDRPPHVSRCPYDIV